MPGTPTPKYQIPTFAAGGTDPLNAGHTQTNNALSTIDSNMSGYATGTLGARPPAGKAGLFYRCTDTGQVFVDIGSAWVELSRPSVDMGAFRTVGQASIAVAAGATAGTYYAANGSPVATGVASGGLVPAGIPVIGADHFVSGLTAQYRVEAAWITNAVAPAVTFTLGLYPITNAAGGASSVTITLGTVVSGSTVALTSPAAGSSGTVSSSDFTLSSSGVYLLGYVNSGTTAASSFTTLGLALRVHNI